MQRAEEGTACKEIIYHEPISASGLPYDGPVVARWRVLGHTQVTVSQTLVTITYSALLIVRQNGAPPFYFWRSCASAAALPASGELLGRASFAHVHSAARSAAARQSASVPQHRMCTKNLPVFRTSLGLCTHAAHAHIIRSYASSNVVCFNHTASCALI